MIAISSNPNLLFSISSFTLFVFGFLALNIYSTFNSSWNGLTLGFILLEAIYILNPLLLSSLNNSLVLSVGKVSFIGTKVLSRSKIKHFILPSLGFNFLSYNF